MPSEILVERVLGGDEDPETLAPPPCTTPLLPKRRGRSGEPNRNRAIQVADVDTQLERVGRDDAEQLPVGEGSLDPPAILGRCIPRGRRRAAEPLRGRAVRALASISYTNSQPARLLANTMVRTPRATSPASSVAASPNVLARTPSSSSSSGGFQMAISRSAAGEPSSSTTVTGPPASRSAASPGLAMVADVIANLGLAPYSRHSLRNRAMTFTTWAPNTPRYAWASSMTTHSRLCSTSAHAECRGRMPACSMSGLVSNRLPASARRVGREVRCRRRTAPGGRRAPCQPCERAGLILRERLGGVEVDRAGLGIGLSASQHRQVERQRLARRRGGDDREVPLPGRGVRLGLVAVEARDPGLRESFSQSRVEIVGEWFDHFLVCRQDLARNHLLHFEQVAPGGGRADGHGRAAAGKQPRYDISATFDSSVRSASATCGSSGWPSRSGIELVVPRPAMDWSRLQRGHIHPELCQGLDRRGKRTGLVVGDEPNRRPPVG